MNVQKLRKLCRLFWRYSLFTEVSYRMREKRRHKFTAVKRWISREQDRILRNLKHLDGVHSNDVWFKLKVGKRFFIIVPFNCNICYVVFYS